MFSPSRHPILERPCAGRRRTRVVDELVVHHGLTDFRTLCERVVTPRTRYIVFDMDRTVHLGRNLGELLGWELCALASYGEDYLKAVEPERESARFVFAPRRPAATAHYLLHGSRLWAYPGLLYFLTVKLGSRSSRVRPLLYRRFGADPIEALQDVPRTAMMHHLSEVPLELLRTLAQRIWHRYEADQVVRAEHITWLRERCPGVRIILSSASPLPTVQVAAQELGTDEMFCTELEEHGGYLSSPFVLDRRFMLLRPPRRVSPPSEVHINAGASKITRLKERHPDFDSLDVETVGITDTSYGEDHPWANHLTRVIDINSPTPFAPILFRDSPLRSIDSAQVATRAELEGEPAASPGRAPSRRQPLYGPLPHRRWLADELATKLDHHLRAAEQLAAEYRSLAGALDSERTASREQVADWLARIEDSAIVYNAATGHERRRALRGLRRDLKGYQAAIRDTVRLERPLSLLTCRLDDLLAASRQSLV